MDFSWQPVFFVTIIILFLTNVSLTVDAEKQFVKPRTLNVTELSSDKSSLCPENQFFFFGCHTVGTLSIPNPTAGCGHNGLMCANASCPDGYTMLSSNCELTIALSPLKQFKAGSTFDNITCKQDLVKIAKLEDGSTACVKPSTQIILEEREWTLPITQPNKDIIFCQKNPSSDCNYTMRLWYNDCIGFENQNRTSCHDGRIEAYLKANGLWRSVLMHP